jgi:hypothetical protein
MHAKKNKKGDLNQLSIRQTIKLDTVSLNKHVQSCSDFSDVSNKNKNVSKSRVKVK